MNKKKVLTIKEAAQVIDGINEFRIRQMCKSGQLRTFKAGKKFLIAESDLYEAVFGKYDPNEDGGAA
ncbi:MAG: helix-turn-helix domain-containing protein [Ruminiclostridium sp.]|nr:helix-turn-helix domain-containing protein [Ruminiclostridium sp.]